MAQLFAMLAGVNATLQQMQNEMKANLKENAKEIKEEMKNGMKEDMKEMQGEMQQMGRGLQAGIKAIAGELIMATPRAGANELRGSVDCVGPAGEDKLIRGTCWARSVRVTERATVTVTEREKLIGVTETCTREIIEGRLCEELSEIVKN